MPKAGPKNSRIFSYRIYKFKELFKPLNIIIDSKRRTSDNISMNMVLLKFRWVLIIVDLLNITDKVVCSTLYDFHNS